jgi:hypothetical protein
MVNCPLLDCGYTQNSYVRILKRERKRKQEEKTSPHACSDLKKYKVSTQEGRINF